jgi:hypothetical protein
MRTSLFLFRLSVGLVVMATGPLTGCGAPDEPAAASRSTLGTRTGGPTDDGQSFDWGGVSPRVLSLTSQRRSIESRSLELALKLGWAVEVQVAVGATVQLITESEVTLEKRDIGPDSRILADAAGTLDVRDGEPFVGVCRYAAMSLLRINRGSTLSLGGVQIESNSDTVRGVEVGIAGHDFDIQPGWTLASVEELCLEQFSEEVAARIEREVEAAVRSRVEVVKHGDDRIEGLHALLKGEAAELVHRGHRFRAEPPVVRLRGEKIVVEGSLRRQRLLLDDHYDFRFGFDREQLRLVATEIAPRGVEPKDRAALSLAAFVARNVAAKTRAAMSGTAMVVDTTLLDAF